MIKLWNALLQIVNPEDEPINSADELIKPMEQFRPRNSTTETKPPSTA